MENEVEKLKEQAKFIAEELKLKKRELRKQSTNGIKWISKMWNWIKNYPEFVTVPIVLFLWLFIPVFLRLFDPSAGGFNVGYLQIPLTSILFVMIFISVSLHMLKLLNGTLYKYLTGKQYKNDFENLTSWQRIVLSYSVYFLYFLAFALLSFIR